MRDIALEYLRYHKYGVVDGEGNEAVVLYPFLLMDLEYSLWQEVIRPMKVKGMLKKRKSEWSEAYNRFNRELFIALDAEQTERFVDLMDEYERWMGNDVMVARVAAMDEIVRQTWDRPLEEQQVLSACLICNCLAQCANIAWEDTHLKKENRDIAAVERAALNFSDEYMKLIGDGSCIKFSGSKRFEAAMNAITRKVTHFGPLEISGN